jgi:Na+-transporting NADH:ubiquinone oxidoreductase subunit A
MKTVLVRRGLTLSADGAPQQCAHRSPNVNTLAWQPPAGARFDPQKLVVPGQLVARGDPLFVDYRAPDIQHVAPGSGTVLEIIRNTDRSLKAIEITRNDAPARQFATDNAQEDADRLRQVLMQSGLWTQLRERPFEITPAINSVPASIFVTALNTRPLAPDPRVIIAQDQVAFSRGLDALSLLSAGAVYVCQSSGPELHEALSERLESVVFNGPHPAGLPGIHIQKLCPVGRQRRAWHIDCQDVMAIGALLRDGELPGERIVSLAGTQVLKPRLIRTCNGARIDELIQDQIKHDLPSAEPIVGSVISQKSSQWLGRFDNQITIMTRPAKPHQRPPPGDALVPDISHLGFVATPRLDRVNAFDTLPAPLLRALLTDDLVTAEALGCLEMAPEDLDLFSFICPSGNNYAQALARCHRQLQGHSA